MESVEKTPNECKEEETNEQCIKMDDGVKILAQIEDEGKPIVLVHGYALTHDMWRYQRPYLKSRGYKVVAIDLRGLVAQISQTSRSTTPMIGWHTTSAQ